MGRVKLHKGALVEVKWLDSYTPSRPGWMMVNEYRKWSKGKVIYHTSGYIIGKSKHYLRIVGDLGGGCLGRCINIPRRCVIRVKVRG